MSSAQRFDSLTDLAVEPLGGIPVVADRLEVARSEVAVASIHIRDHVVSERIGECGSKIVEVPRALIPAGPAVSALECLSGETVDAISHGVRDVRHACQPLKEDAGTDQLLSDECRTELKVFLASSDRLGDPKVV